MSLPTNQLVYAGVWDAAVYYNQFQFVESPTDSKSYAYVGEPVLLGGADPATLQPSAIWIPFPVATGGGITSLNGLTDPAMLLTSTDLSVKITPTAPDKVDLSVGFPQAYGSFSSTQTQLLPAGTPLPFVYDTKDVASSTGVNVLFPSSEIIVTNAGTYKILSSLQCDSTIGLQTMNMYLQVNGTPVANTASRVIVNLNLESLMTVEWFVDLGAGDRVEVVGYDSIGGSEALAIAAAPPVPAVPSIITTILRIA
jgi:hypothetical protein